jgi:hypothetical protein
MVPGKPLAAWSGPEGSSLVVYRTLPWPGGTAEMIAESLATRLTNLPELKVAEKRLEKVAGLSAARVESVGAGNGDAFAPSGVGTPIATQGKPLISTRQVTLGIPRSDGTLFLSWHMPESVHEKLTPGIDATLASLHLSAETGQSSYSY